MLDAVKRDEKPESTVDEEDGSRGRAVICRACGHRITSVRARIEMSGAHAHTFVNPHGHVFHIGCYGRAPGATLRGRPSHEFSWFPGYAWRVATCGGCAVHLGWGFGDGPDFVGLIRDRVGEGEGPRS